MISTEVLSIQIGEYRRNPQAHKISRAALEAERSYGGLDKREPSAFRPRLLRAEVLGRTFGGLRVEEAYEHLTGPQQQAMRDTLERFERYSRMIISALRQAEDLGRDN